MASAAPPADPVALSYPLTGLAAVAALTGLACAIIEIYLTRQSGLHALLTLRPLANLNSALTVVLSCAALLLLLVGGDASLRGRGGPICAAGARLVLVTHCASLAADFITACAALCAARCPQVQPAWLRRTALLLLFLLTWALGICVVLLPSSDATPCNALLLTPGTPATLLLVIEWILLTLSAGAEIIRAVLQVRFFTVLR